jgi:hypothetical protein
MNLPSWLKTLGGAAALAGSLAATDTPADQPDQSRADSLDTAVERVTTERATQNTEKYYAKPNADASNPGTSWDDATTLRSALDNAADGDSVLVMNGEYETNGVAFQTDGEHVLGGIQDEDNRRIDDAFTADGQPTTLRGGGSNHVLRMDGGSITNVEITGGDADGTGSDALGGGILITGGDNDIHRSMIHDNQATTGAAVYADNTATSVDITSSKINANTSEHGSAVTLDETNGEMSGNTIVDNTTASTGYFTFNSNAGTAESILGFNADQITVTNNALRRAGTADVGLAHGDITGTVKEEGQPLDATITASYDDITKAQTQATNGSFTLPLVLGERDIKVGFSSAEHENTYETVSFTGDTTVDINANRTAYDLSTTIGGIIGGETGELTVRDDDSELFTVFTGNGDALYSITSDDDELSITLDTPGHEHLQTTTSLDGDETQPVSLEATPFTYTTNVVSTNADSIHAQHDNQTIIDAAMPPSDTLSFDATVADDVLPGEQINVTATADNATPASKTVTADTTNREQTITVEPIPNPDNATATYQGNVLEEGSTLANADITIRNNSADTLITTTETNAAGDYQATHTYPENQGYEAQIIADKADHQADTTTAEVGTSDDTYTNDFDLERRVHEFTITTDDADTGTPVDAAGAITTGTDTLTTYQTGPDGQTTIPVETLSDQVNVSADNDDYEPTTVTEQLGSDENVSTSISLTPQPENEPMTITVNAHEIGEDLYEGGYAPNPEDITITTPDTTITADFQNETATFTIPDTSSVDDITLSHDDTTDYHPAVSLFKTAEQNPIDLTQSTDEFDEFPREPYAQSNYGDNTDTNDRTITIPRDDLVDTYELRFIPSETPRGNSTADDYVPHLNQGRSKRFKNRTVGDTTYTQDKLFIVEHNENNWLTKASNAYDDVRDTLPFPTSQPDTISYDSLLTIRAERNYMNVTDIEEGSNGNAIFDGPRFIEESVAKASPGTTQRTFISEAYSSFNGYGTTGDDEPGDTIFDENGDFIKDEAAFPMRIQYSSFSDNDNF